MKAILLCAGQGSRLRPLTNDRPKGMVEVGGKSILERQLALFKSVGIDDIVVVGGYCHEAIPADGIVKRINDEYDTTNMVVSLFVAEQDMLGDAPVIVSYADIIYTKQVLEATISSTHSSSVVIDLDWFEYFSKRNDNVLDDAESLMLDDQGCIINIGAKANSVAEIEAQYIGLMKFDVDAITNLRELFHAALADGSDIGWGRPIRQAFMTDLIQESINRGSAVHGVPIRGGWCEIDTPLDFALAEAMLPQLEG